MENPGRQSISGSFNPIDVGEWSQQVYVGQTEKFFAAIVTYDKAAVAWCIQEGIDVDRRDHVGRTPLHVAILSNAVDIACDLIDVGARMTARVVDGRTSLHLAVQLDQLVVVRKLLERSAVNAEQAEKEAIKKEAEVDHIVEKADVGMDVDVDVDIDSDRLSSDDDWSSDGADNADGDNEENVGGEDEDKDTIDDGEEGPNRKECVAMPPPESNAGNLGGIPEDEEDKPDIIDVNLPDWDLAFTPLMYGVLFASLSVVEELLAAGADVKLATKANSHNAPPFYPLTLTILAEDEDRACKVAERLLLAGASSSKARDGSVTIFHQAVMAGKTKLVSSLLRCDPNASMVLKFPYVTWNTVIFPITTAISNRSYSVLGVLLAHGAKLLVTEEDISQSFR
jgi:ankyrin repeat protein